MTRKAWLVQTEKRVAEIVLRKKFSFELLDVKGSVHHLEWRDPGRENVRTGRSRHGSRYQIVLNKVSSQPALLTGDTDVNKAEE